MGFPLVMLMKTAVVGAFVVHFAVKMLRGNCPKAAKRENPDDNNSLINDLVIRKSASIHEKSEKICFGSVVTTLMRSLHRRRRMEATKAYNVEKVYVVPDRELPRRQHYRQCLATGKHSTQQRIFHLPLPLKKDWQVARSLQRAQPVDKPSSAENDLTIGLFLHNLNLDS